VTRFRRLDPKTLVLEDPLGNRHAIVLEPEGAVIRRMACGVHEVAQFDSLGRCLGKHLFPADTQAPVWRRRFEYSPEGDLVRVEDSERGTTEYRHDAAHQLAEVIAPDGQGSGRYRYDAGWNLIEAPHLSGVEVAPGNKLVKANGGILAYDHRNNVSSWQRERRELRFYRDGLDRLRRIDGLDKAWSADYDPLGRRTRKTYGTEVTEYFWDTDRLAAELRPGGQLRVYVYADDFSLTPWLAIDYDSVDAEPASGHLHYLVTDQRGAPVAALDAAGRRVWSASLEPYGLADIEKSETSAFELSQRLAGQCCDAETGLYYNRFRYYSPELGRYIEEDPAGTGGAINLYGYTDNPLLPFDARGLSCELCGKKHEIEAHPLKKLSTFLRNKLKRIKNATASVRGKLSPNTGITGSVSKKQAILLGIAWVGPGYRKNSKGTGLVSASGDKTFRFPSSKKGRNPATGEPWSKTGTQANFETKNGKDVVSNVHLDVDN
jgi:RHS repeat-associated protein